MPKCWILRCLSNALRFDSHRRFTEDGNLKCGQDLDEVTADALTRIEVVEVKSSDGTSKLPTRKNRGLTTTLPVTSPGMILDDQSGTTSRLFDKIGDTTSHC